MQCCAAPAPGRRSTWISPEFIEAYTQLHQQGHAHSLECWQGRQLVGGVYGVAVGGFFAGESMFHRVSDASKVALFHLIEHLRNRGFALFDIQMLTPITEQLGGITIPGPNTCAAWPRRWRSQSSFSKSSKAPRLRPNPKTENRKPKEIRGPKSEIKAAGNSAPARKIRPASDLGLPIPDFLRISNFSAVALVLCAAGPPSALPFTALAAPSLRA